MSIGSIICLILSTALALMMAIRESDACTRHKRPLTEWAWLCFGMFVLFAGMTINAILTVAEKGIT